MNTIDQIRLFIPILSKRNQQLFGIWCAERIFTQILNPDPRLDTLIKTKKQWLDGLVSNEEMTKVIKDASTVPGSGSATVRAHIAGTYDAAIAFSSSFYAATNNAAHHNKEQIAQLCQILKMLGEQIKK